MRMKQETKKTMSVSTHKQLVTFFSDTALKARGFRPSISPSDAKRLQYVVQENILSQTQIEQLMLFFLADRNYKNLGPSIATMLSSTILNSLRNRVLNSEKFYQELEVYRARYINDRTENIQESRSGAFALSERLKKLSEKMSVVKRDRAELVKKTRKVGLF